MGIDINEERINNIYPLDNSFILMTDKNEYEAKAVILSGGSPVGKQISGEKKYLGKGVSYCATCDGNLYRNKTIAVICDDEKLEEEVEYLSTLAEKIYYNPTFASNLKKDNIETQTGGEVYAMHFVYSGNFELQAGLDQFDQIRLVMGINPYNFTWRLGAGEHFQAPETVMIYSDSGLGHMTRTFHDLYRNHLIRSAWRDRKRPILINNWEGTYFDFNTDKLLAIASGAAILFLVTIC